jgi:hypothetical protein
VQIVVQEWERVLAYWDGRFEEASDRAVIGVVGGTAGMCVCRSAHG